jgi:hypothetical protein
MPDVPRRERCLPRNDDPGDLDIANLDGSTAATLLSRNGSRCGRGRKIEGENPVIENDFKGVGVSIFQLSPATTRRHHLDARADLIGRD